MTLAAQRQFPFGQPVVWQPSDDTIRRSRLKRFMDRHGLETFDALMTRSTEDIGWFWEAVFEDLSIEFYEPYEQVVDLSSGIEWPRWCVGGRLNIVHNCVDKWMGTPTEGQLAIRWEDEQGTVRRMTYGQLQREVNRVAAGLRAAGLGKGDVIGLYMPMIPEIVVALLAIAKIGAVILPLFSGFGAGALTTRLTDAGAKALFTADGMARRGRRIPMKPQVDEALAACPEVRTVIVFPRLDSDAGMTAGRDLWWDDLVAGQPSESPTERTAAEDLLMLIYTSGTTGRPKGAVHTHCGFPLKAAQDMAHGFDVQQFDTLSWMTDMGWMMGPWMVYGVLILGATMFFYDGAPDTPDVDQVWALLERHGVTCFGTAPTFIRAIMQHGDEPVLRHDLSALRILGSTGEAWNPEPWHWFFDTVGGGRLPIINYSGGTEISGGILMGNLLRPLKPCGFSAAPPGMAVDVVDESGHPVRGAVGELVVRQPWIGMTRGFWRDRERYLQTYWSRFPSVWVHGDFAAIDEDGQWFILGRSDDTIKVGGKRVGPAEVESVLVSHAQVTEAAAIGVPHDIKGEVVVVFVVLQPDVDPSDGLRDELKFLVTREMGKPLAPQDVRYVTDIPKTRNAKVMRRVIRAAYLGEPAGDLSALVNPEAVGEIERAT
jgi:acetyl-CoA synthetase